MRGIAIIVAVVAAVVVACGVSTEDLADQTKQSMQKHMDTDPKLVPYHVVVKEVALVHSSGNEYTGFATVQPLRGDSRKVPVTVTSDGDQSIWQCPPGAFAFLVLND